MNNEKRGFAGYRALKAKTGTGLSCYIYKKKRESLYNDSRQNF